MKVIVVTGYSNAGKTTLMEKLIPALKALGQRVSVVKHAHHRFEMDHPGKDTWRHREAGAFEVVAASPHRLVLIREFEQSVELPVHAVLAMSRYDEPAVAHTLGWDPAAVVARGRELRRAEGRP